MLTGRSRMATPTYVKQPTDYVKSGALRAIEPAISFLARHNVSPNTITTAGTLLTIAASVVYATGHIMTAGWIMNVTAFFDVADGEVARRTGKSSVFGAFYDSTLDRVADGALMAGLAFFYATNVIHHNLYMVAACLICMVGTFLISYTRARAESLGVDAKVGVMQRPERMVLLSIPQSFFGLFWNGWVLMGIILLLTVTAWITAIQRIAFVYRATKRVDNKPIRIVNDPASPGVAAPPKPAGIAASRRAKS
jgi:CDP-diacylglycerol--glycerol-3-phosphate 3-phosphatidyltransferase